MEVFLELLRCLVMSFKSQGCEVCLKCESVLRCYLVDIQYMLLSVLLLHIVSHAVQFPGYDHIMSDGQLVKMFSVPLNNVVRDRKVFFHHIKYTELLTMLENSNHSPIFAIQNSVNFCQPTCLIEILNILGGCASSVVTTNVLYLKSP